MNEFYETAFSPVNLPYTIVMIVLTVYWVIAIAGLVDIGAFDFDLDTDGDVAGADGLDWSGSWLFGFLNIGEVPIMFYLSVVALSMWVGSLQLNDWLGNQSIWVALVLAVPNLMVGLLVAKLVTSPVKWMSNARQKETPLEGKLCLVQTSEVNHKFGECRIETGEAPIIIAARTQGDEILRKGDAAIVVRRNRRNNTYVVTRHTATETTA